ncbi:mRNA guanylyltransferase [Malassezia furfur]|uniref:mRNA-capping enzyme subunit alpha n=1 Tax=Malassezia furfur TaxID=55194 RepID=A0ABY8EW13_MALFU|nr:CEG1 [Malassezia furfur]WFD49807.1 mRNA guanylyltransferase [Malassezia furfur]
MPVPDIPGTKLPEGQQLMFLRDHVRELCRLNSTKFPGAQPVSFNKQSLDLLLKEDFWVCEKSDGQRVLVLIVVPPATGQQEVFLIDRKNNYYQVHNLSFPHHNPNSPEAAAFMGQRTNTLVDGELVVDTISPEQTKLRLLLFDCLVIDGENVTRKPFGRRYARLSSHLYPPYKSYMAKNKMAQVMAPFEVQVKPMDLAYGIEKVLLGRMKHLHHESDGLIFTSFPSGYTCGTDPKILKWKPPQDNTIDFKLELRFPPDLQNDPSGATPDYRAKPFIKLMQHSHGHHHELFDYLEMSDEEWERWKQSGEQLDDRIVECAWRPREEGSDEFEWHIFRIRDDKQYANHKSTVKRILESIKDGVQQQELIDLAPAIRAAWKTPEREKFRQSINRSKGKNVVPFIRGGGGPGPPMRRGGMPGINRR